MKSFLLTVVRVTTRPFRRWGLTRFYPFYVANLAYKKVFESLRPATAIIHGNIMFLDPLDSLGLLYAKEHYEENTTRLFQKILRPGDTVVDLGASIGYFTLLAAKLVGGTGRVFSFEADPSSFSYLSKSIEANHYVTVTAVHRAVSDVTGKRLPFYTSAATSSLFVRGGGGHETSEVETITLDDFFKDRDVSNIALMKIDIEGSEAAALRGMKGLFKNNKIRRIIMEFGPSAFVAAGEDALGCLTMLSETGFKLYNIEAGMTPIHVEDINEPIESYVEKTGIANIFCERA